MRRSAIVLSLALLAATAVTAPLAAQDTAKATHVTEPESKIKLPIELKVLDDKATHTLTGVAIREKTIFKVDVYAVGHYVDAAKAREALAKWKGKTAKQLADDDDFTAKLLAPGFGRSLRLHLARDIDSEDFNEAFEDALGPRVKQLVNDGVKGTEKDVATLKGYFTVDELAEGTKIDMTWTSDGKLTTVMDGKKLGVIASPALCQAMWDIYFGDDAIQDEFPGKLVERFPGLLGK